MSNFVCDFCEDILMDPLHESISVPTRDYDEPIVVRFSLVTSCPRYCSRDCRLPGAELSLGLTQSVGLGSE